MQLKVGLPYDIERMNEIKEQGAIVDMSNIKYPAINPEDNVRVSYIYLRNTDFQNISLDFKKCSYEFKKDFIKFYLKGDIEYPISEMDETWIQILGQVCNQHFQTNSILTDDEVQMFIKDEKDLLKETLTFIFSLPLYVIHRFDLDTPVKFDGIEHVKGKVFNNNITNIIKNDFFNILFLYPYDGNPLFYDDLFTEDNNKLFETVSIHTPFSTLLYGMNSKEEWTKFVEGMENLILLDDNNG